MKRDKIIQIKNKIITVSLVVAILTSATVSVSAASLTKDSNEGNTEVTAKILGEDEPEPGNVSYIISIPDKIDFGTLARPSSDTDSYKDVDFTITAAKIEGFEEHGDWYVRVKTRDENYKMDEEERFFISQKTVTYPDTPTAGNNKFEYSVYVNDTSISTGNRRDENGINIAFFKATGQSVTGKLRLNQRQLYGRSIKDIAGEYSGCMIFHSSIVSSTSLN